jgi:hypothetical protein
MTRGIDDGQDDTECREPADRAQVERQAVAKDEAADPLFHPWHVGHVHFELAPPGTDQVVPDVAHGVPGASLRRLSRALDRAQRHTDLSFPARFGQFLDGLAVPVPAGEVHAAVDSCGIPLEHVLHQAHLLDRAVPVDRGHQPQARDRVAHGRVSHGLPLMLGADGLVDAEAHRLETALELDPQLRDSGTQLAHALDELNHESVRKGLGERGRGAVSAPDSKRSK